MTEEQSQRLAKDIANQLWKPVRFVAAITLLSLGVLYWWNHDKPVDPTDPPEGRSGLLYWKDHGTGVEYIGNPHGGIVVRQIKEDGEE